MYDTYNPVHLILHLQVILAFKVMTLSVLTSVCVCRGSLLTSPLLPRGLPKTITDSGINYRRQGINIPITTVAETRHFKALDIGYT